MENNVTEFILLGLSQEKKVEVLCFLLFLLCYIAILTGNLLIMVSITCSQLINQPMYFFLSYFSFSDLCYTSTVTPKLIMDFLAEKKAISYNGCVTQLFTTHFFGSTEVFILTGMAYDCYVAICKPLHYTTIMSPRRCNIMIAASCAGGFLRSVCQFLLAICLPYCGPNEIDHYFCDVYPLLKLACADTSRIGLLVIASSGLMSLVIFVILLISYAVFLYTVRSYSVENRAKLFPCTLPISLWWSFFLFLYSSFTFDQPLLYQKTKLLLFFYTIMAPMPNPLIYTLRNTEMKNAIKKLWLHIREKKGNRVKDILGSYH